MKKLTLLGLLFLQTFFAFGQPHPQSRIETATIYSEVLKAEREYTIYLPVSFDVEPTREYPILYLLHGMTDNNWSWYGRGHLKEVMDVLVASGEAVEMIVVTPNAGGSFEEGNWNGYFDMPGWKYETFFYEEFLPHIEKTYRVIGDKKNRAVAGLSMGGGGATRYGQRHPEMFSAVYAMSALMSIPEHDMNRKGDPEDKFMILTRSVIENSCVRYVEEADEARKEQLRSVSWFVDCGDDDFLLDRNIEFYQAMRNAHIPCQFRVRDGGHSWEYWHSALYICLPYVSARFRTF